MPLKYLVSILLSLSTYSLDKNTSSCLLRCLALATVMEVYRGEDKGTVKEQKSLFAVFN